MRTLLSKLWTDVTTSYWFVPSLMSVGSAVLAVVMLAIDASLQPAWLIDSGWAGYNSAEGARTLLATVAGSMIGVAGVTFSITIASVVYASGQYGPRLLKTFMADRGSQVTLGTFIATFLYGLLVLRTIRADSNAVPEFLPHLSILAAVALAIASVAVLIYFLHHAPRSLEVSKVIAEVGREFEAALDRLFPERLSAIGPGRASEIEAAGRAEDVACWTRSQPIEARRTGFVQAIDEDGLVRLAEDEGLFVRVLRCPGAFAAGGDALAEVVGLGDSSRERVARRIASKFVLGATRTPIQDARFILGQIVDIAVRALSPGINDPRTAMDCVHWIVALLKQLAQRVIPRNTCTARCAEAADVCRVFIEPASFNDFLDVAFLQLRPHIAREASVASHALTTMAELAERCPTRERRQGVIEHAWALAQATEERLESAIDAKAVRRHCEGLFGSRPTPDPA